MSSVPSRAVRTVLVVAVLAAGGTAGGYAVTRGPGTDAATAGGATSASTPAAELEADRTAAEPVSTEPPAQVATDAAVPSTSDPDDADPDEADPDEADPERSADVVISFADWVPEAGGVELSGFVSGGHGAGTCVATLTRGDVAATVSAEAVPNGATAACGGFTVPGDELSGGEWEAVLSYEAGGTTSRSEAVVVTVP